MQVRSKPCGRRSGPGTGTVSTQCNKDGVFVFRLQQFQRSDAHVLKSIDPIPTKYCSSMTHCLLIRKTTVERFGRSTTIDKVPPIRKIGARHKSPTQRPPRVSTYSFALVSLRSTCCLYRGSICSGRVECNIFPISSFEAPILHRPLAC